MKEAQFPEEGHKLRKLIATKRYYNAWMCCLGFMITFGLRCNPGVAHVALQELDKHHNLTHAKADDRYMPWSPGQKGVLSSSFFYGYIITQVPGGIIVSKFPANRIFGIAVGGSALLNLFLPLMYSTHTFFGVILVRIMQGLIEGSSYPACSYAGVVFGLALSSILTQHIGWQTPFYFYGILGTIWFGIWWKTSYEKPSEHPTISTDEREFIEACIGPDVHSDHKLVIPWKSIATSMPVYAIVVANFARSWSFYLFIVKTVDYFHDVHGEKISESGLLSSLPHLIMATLVPVAGNFADKIRKRHLSTTVTRKLFNCGGFGMEALFLFCLANAQTLTQANIFINLAVGFSGFAISGYNVNHLDIAPRYASVLMGLSNGFGTLSGFLCPYTAEKITASGGDKKHAWKIVFIIAGLIHTVGVTFYAIFASGEVQPWAEPPEETITWKPPPNLPSEAVNNDYGYGGTVTDPANTYQQQTSQLNDQQTQEYYAPNNQTNLGKFNS
ncbi:hypothetical protein Ciccas_006203 [Cichlidogyrus casuarinus]|uniref:Uncharacterized protein n=1 Tax=Cichlidogyrus casuarinus TaxID=1844966 RepID=A0ABD2Q7G4_9PLAT